MDKKTLQSAYYLAPLQFQKATLITGFIKTEQRLRLLFNTNRTHEAICINDVMTFRTKLRMLTFGKRL